MLSAMQCCCSLNQLASAASVSNCANSASPASEAARIAGARPKEVIFVMVVPLPDTVHDPKLRGAA